MTESKARQALSFAREKLPQCKNWMELHNLLYGIGGKCGELFPTQEERQQFFDSPEHEQIRGLLDSLPGPDSGADVAERISRTTGTISLHLPRTLHAALVAEAEAEGVSLEQLCQAKLSLQLGSLVRVSPSG